MTKTKALLIAKSKDFGGYTLYDLEQIFNFTGSKEANKLRRKKIDAMGDLVKDEFGNLRE